MSWKLISALAFCALAAPMAACDDETTIDASSVDSLQESLQEMAEELSEEEADELGMMLTGIVLSEGGDGLFTGEVDDDILNMLDGMSAADIRAKAEELGVDDVEGTMDLDIDHDVGGAEPEADESGDGGGDGDDGDE